MIHLGFVISTVWICFLIFQIQNFRSFLWAAVSETMTTYDRLDVRFMQIKLLTQRLKKQLAEKECIS